jgi:Glycosyltransferase family 87
MSEQLPGPSATASALLESKASTMTNSRWYRLVAAFLIAMFLAHVVEFWQQKRRIFAGYGDFAAFYTAGLIARRGRGQFLYDLREQWNSQQEFAANVDIRQGPMPFVRPPFEALLFLPLSFFPYPLAFGIWSFAKLGLLLFALWILPRGQPFGRIWPAWLEAVLCLGFFPVFLDLFQGQDAIVLLVVMVGVFALLSADRNVTAGLVLALGLFKFHLVIPIAIMLILAGRPRLLAGFAPGATVLAGISCAISGTSVLHTYPMYLLHMNRLAGVGFVHPQSMPNLRGLLTMWVGRDPYPGRIHWILLPVAIAAMFFTAQIWRRAMKADASGFAVGYCLALAVSILTSYYAYAYDIALLIVPLFLLSGPFLDQPEVVPRSRFILRVAFLFLACTPLDWLLALSWDCPYLLAIPMLVLVAGLVEVLRQKGRALPIAVSG